MSLILNIDTAVEGASVCLANEGKPLQLMLNTNQKDHAAWMHKAIEEMLKANNITLQQLEAVAVNIGPGSYTGLRIGLSAAKGFCFALNIPLITVSSLELIAFAAMETSARFICPLIDARRMEVFTALFDAALNEIEPPHALILNENSFAELLNERQVLFCGNAVQKAKTVIATANAVFSLVVSDASHLAVLSHRQFVKKDFADLAYSEPLYVKEFYSPVGKK